MFSGYGGPEVLQLQEATRPVVRSGEVLVRVAATSFNPADSALRAGLAKDFLTLPLPYTVGLDLAGTVEDVGADVVGFAPGDEVVAYILAGYQGAAAEYAIVKAEALARAPKSIPLVDAAALPTTGLTAHQAVFGHGLLRSGERVLVNGGGSAVGALAVQMAVHAGAEVTAYAGPASIDRVRAHGATAVFDYTQSALRSTITRSSTSL